MMYSVMLSRGAVVAAGSSTALGANERVAFAGNYMNGARYATVPRGNIREEIFTRREAIAAARAGQPLPDGKVIVGDECQGDELCRSVAMKKRAGWGTAYPEVERSGDWGCHESRPDRIANLGEGGPRRMSCHNSQASNNVVFTYDCLRSPR